MVCRLYCNEEKLIQHFRLAAALFDYVLNHIRYGLTSKPYNRHKNPVSPRRKIKCTAYLWENWKTNVIHIFLICRFDIWKSTFFILEGKWIIFVKVQMPRTDAINRNAINKCFETTTNIEGHSMWKCRWNFNFKKFSLHPLRQI